MIQLFAWGGQSTGVSALASFLSKNTQGWSPLEWTGWISLQSMGLSRVFSNTTVQNWINECLFCPAFISVVINNFINLSTQISSAFVSYGSGWLHVLKNHQRSTSGAQAANFRKLRVFSWLNTFKVWLLLTLVISKYKYSEFLKYKWLYYDLKG